MKISLKTRYGLRFMMNLALNSKKQYLQLCDIARRENISEKYLERIVSQLKSAGLVDVKRGAVGGYKLSRAMDRISMKDIIDVLEGPVIPLEQDAGVNDHVSRLVINDILKELRRDIDDFFCSRTLLYLAGEYEKANHTPMFYI